MHISSFFCTFAPDFGKAPRRANAKTEKKMNEVKENIIKKAEELFNQVGIRSCSMDDLCHELGISKKTLYQYFATKEELVDAMLKRHVERAIECAEQDERNHVSAMDVMMHVLESMEKMKDVRRIPPLLYDLKKYYPQQFEAHVQTLAKVNREYMTRLLKRGIDEGDFRADLDAEMGGQMLSELNQQAMNNITRLIQMENFSEFGTFTIDLIIRGIASEQGLIKIKAKS